MTAEDRDWSNILTDIGCVILSKLPEIQDHVWFGAVCKNWYHIAKEYNRLIRPSCGTLPMLLVPVSDCESQRMLYSVSAGHALPRIRLPDIPNKRCCGSSYGWLAFVEEDYSVTLINPFEFRGIYIHLPVLNSKSYARYENEVVKLITTPDSTPDSYTVVAVYGGTGKLATIRSGDDDWTYIVGDGFRPRDLTFCDIVFHKGLVYATDYRFMLVSVNIDLHPPKGKVLKGAEPFNLHEKWAATYIVESTSGDLIVLRRRRESEPVTKVFKVLKLEIHQESGDLVRVVESKSLNGDAIFTGDNYSVAVKASNFVKCEPNAIYFLEDSYVTDRHTNNEYSGIYKVEDKTVSRHYVRDPNHTFRPPAIWVHVHPPYNYV